MPTTQPSIYDTNTFTSTLKSDTPSPLAYNVRPRSFSPKFTMKSRVPALKSQAERTEICSFTYQQDLRPRHDGPKISMSFKYGSEKPNMNPAPNTYSPNMRAVSPQKAIKFGGRTQNTDQFFREKNAKSMPSPDRYQPIYARSKVGFAFDKGARGKDVSKPTSPGPAYLNVSESFKKVNQTHRKATLAGRIEPLESKQISKRANIGPGSYNLPSSMNFGKGATISGRTKMVGSII